MKIKPIILRGDKQKEFIRVIAAQFGTTSDNELKLIATMIDMDLFIPFHLSKHIRKNIQKYSGMPYSTLNTCLRRLTEAGVIARVDGNVYLIPSFRDLDVVDAIVFKMG